MPSRLIDTDRLSRPAKAVYLREHDKTHCVGICVFRENDNAYVPRSVMAANNLAAVLADHRGDTKSLERALLLCRGFESQKPNAYLLHTLGWAHHKLGHSAEAVRVLKQATTLAPDHPVLNYHLGAVYAKAGQRTEAAVHLKKAIEFRASFEGIDEAKTLLAEISG